MHSKIQKDQDTKMLTPQEELELLREAIKDISKSCPLLSKNKNAMYGENQATLFLHSTVRRMEAARNVLKLIEEKKQERIGYTAPKQWDPKTWIPPSTYMNVRVKKAKINGEEYSFYAFYDSLVVFCGILKIDVIHKDSLGQYLTALETNKGDTHV
jgi:hypothetical protein